MNGDEYVKFLVRFPADLLAALKRMAVRHNRTTTAEIVYQLRRIVRADERREPKD